MFTFKFFFRCFSFSKCSSHSKMFGLWKFNERDSIPTLSFAIILNIGFIAVLPCHKGMLILFLLYFISVLPPLRRKTDLDFIQTTVNYSIDIRGLMEEIHNDINLSVSMQ